MPISPQTLDRLTSGLARVIRSGRRLSVRAADSFHGDLPSSGWGLLVPLERDGEQRCSALAAQAGVDVSVASRQLSALERSGCVRRGPDRRTVGRASCSSPTRGPGPWPSPASCAPGGPGPR